MAACSVAHLEGEALLDAAAAEEGGGGPLAVAATLPGTDPPQLPLLVVDRQLSLDALETVRPRGNALVAAAAYVAILVCACALA